MSEKPKPTTGDLSERITEYLCAGGLFNPELMEHEKVRDLLMDCRDALQPKPTGEWTAEMQGGIPLQECRKQLEASQKYAELLEQGRRDAIAAAQQPLVDELQNIVSDLDGMRKDFGDDTDRQFRLWAQSRARSALAKVKEGKA